MNKIFNRTRDSGFLMTDANVDVTTAFYPPNFGDDSDLSVGENDPDKPGAIATLTEGGVTSVWIYQGDDSWKAVGVAPPFELIAFTGSTGEQTIDFTTGGRAALFPRANIRAFNFVGAGVEVEIEGFMKQFTRSGGLITQFYTDGIMGDGYFLITN